MKLPPLVQTFVLHFGEMGSRWGINRTVGQIYALLFVSPAPLNADQIAEKLDFSRSNVSMGLKELEAWRLVRLQHIPGDRREYFSTPEDVWVILRTLAEERRRREVDPTLTMLRDVPDGNTLQRRRAPRAGKNARNARNDRDVDGLVSRCSGVGEQKLDPAAQPRIKSAESAAIGPRYYHGNPAQEAGAQARRRLNLRSALRFCSAVRCTAGQTILGLGLSRTAATFRELRWQPPFPSMHPSILGDRAKRHALMREGIAGDRSASAAGRTWSAVAEIRIRRHERTRHPGCRPRDRGRRGQHAEGQGRKKQSPRRHRPSALGDFRERLGARPQRYERTAFPSDHLTLLGKRHGPRRVPHCGARAGAVFKSYSSRSPCTGPGRSTVLRFRRPTAVRRYRPRWYGNRTELQRQHRT